MTMYYKIGTLAKRFNITTQAIRFYETQGFLTSTRMDDSSTRWYQTRNLKWLSSIRRYHDMGFGTDEIKRLFMCDRPEQIRRHIQDKEGEILRKIAAQEKRLEALQRKKADIDRIDTLLYKCRVEPSPAMWVLPDQYGQTLDESTETEHILRAWIKELAFLYSAILVSKDSVLQKDRINGRCSGFCVDEDVAAKLGLPIKCPVLRFAHDLCIHTVLIRANGDAGIAYLYDYARKNRLEFTADALGRCLTKVDEKRCLDDKVTPGAIYYEYWLPVQARG